jgi:hypothetical protein
MSSLDHVQALLTAEIIDVAQRVNHGLYIYGRPGTSKTHTIHTILRDAGIRFCYQQGHCTPWALFSALQADADGIHVLDDVTELFRQKHGLEICNAALGMQRDGRRIITYLHRLDAPKRVVFTGAIIAIANQPARSQALSSRVHCFHYDLSDDDMDELMARVASGPWTHPSLGASLTSDECKACLAQLRHTKKGLDESGRMVRLDMRHLIKVYSLYLSEKLHHTAVPWSQRLEALLRQEITSVVPRTKAGQIEHERQIAAEILAQHPHRTDRAARLKSWEEETGKSQAALYRRMSELEM